MRNGWSVRLFACDWDGGKWGLGWGTLQDGTWLVVCVKRQHVEDIQERIKMARCASELPLLYVRAYQVKLRFTRADVKALEIEDTKENQL